jgi:Type II/IV secretion system protein
MWASLCILFAIEYEINGASQVEVDSADKVNFSKALRSVLRHDPDVVMIGEIRDEETANGYQSCSDWPFGFQHCPHEYFDRSVDTTD